MPELKQYLIVCPFVFLAGLIDSVAGGGGLISLPAYMASGLPVHMALGTNKFSAVFGTALASVRYYMHKKTDLRTASVSIVFALIGAALGARTVLYIDPLFLQYALLAILPVVAFFVLKKKEFGKESKTEQLSAAKVFFYASAIGLVVGFYDGFFGQGTGTFLVLLYTWLLRCDLITASGNAKVINLASNMAAFATFLLNGEVHFLLGFPAMLCGLAGNFIGSGLALKKGARIIRPVFILALILLIAYVINNLWLSR